MRGYHSQKEKLRGWEDGIVDSYIFAPLIAKNQMRKYTSVEFPMWAREFPISWRDLDHDLLPHVEPTEGVVKPSNHMDASGINGVKPNADMPVVPTTQGNQMDSLKTTLNAENKPQDHRVAGLNCERYGGPSEKIAAEMIYWEDIPRDAQFVSPYATYGKTPKYLTFEPDVGGWNNVRMAMETATVLAQAMGRILVLPPEQTLWNLDKEAQQGDNQFTFRDFFHFDSIAAEYPAVEIISMEEFFKREALTGGLTNRYTGKVELPPFAVSSWNGHFRSSTDKWMWLRNVTTVPIWSYDDCVVGFPAAPGPEGVRSLEAVRARIPAKDQPWVAEFGSGITAVDAAPIDRLREVLDTRRNMCIYDEKYQNEKVIHFMGESDLGARLLVHFYGYLFFEDHHRDLRTKRFVRDHLRYVDEIQCAAARIVDAVRQKAIENGDPNGIYDSFHIRRGDFETIFPYSFVSAEEIYENTKDILVPNSTVFIATDEQNATYFDPLRKHYHLLFLDDFRHLLGDLNKNYLGMVDQREASRGRTFVGTHYSSFSGMY